MARRICQSLLAVAIVYALAVAVFSFLHYSPGERPDVVTTAKEFHLFVIGRLPAKSAPPEPGAVPPAAPTPPPSVEPPPPPEPPPEDERAKAIRVVRDELLPRARRQLAEIPKAAGADHLDKKAEARKTLVEARDLLGPLLDRKRDDPDVQKVYQQVMDLLAPLSKG
jgi:hypothetical protein